MSIERNGRKVCIACGKEKDVSEFGRDVSNTDNLNSRCKPCAKAWRTERRKKNKKNATRPDVEMEKVAAQLGKPKAAVYKLIENAAKWDRERTELERLVELEEQYDCELNMAGAEGMKLDRRLTFMASRRYALPVVEAETSNLRKRLAWLKVKLDGIDPAVLARSRYNELRRTAGLSYRGPQIPDELREEMERWQNERLREKRRKSMEPADPAELAEFEAFMVDIGEGDTSAVARVMEMQARFDHMAQFGTAAEASRAQGKLEQAEAEDAEVRQEVERDAYSAALLKYRAKQERGELGTWGEELPAVYGPEALSGEQKTAEEDELLIAAALELQDAHVYVRPDEWKYLMKGFEQCEGSRTARREAIERQKRRAERFGVTP